ncbi:MAG: prepilin-type N-terminal cleavage/methylation domain-containing protein [Verrucomicrobiae bacterium]|nr:prepilin-type N-terminal cleavage/methylation domain-containing protein [Verrucomicrobiae bacterium]
MIQKLRSDNGGFTLVEIMIVVAIIGLLAAIAVPSFIRARTRSQATTILNECRMLDAALDQYALENNKQQSNNAAFADLTPYLKAGSRLAASNGSDTLGNAFLNCGSSAGAAISLGVRVSSTTKTALSSATGGDTFWGPYS